MNISRDEYFSLSRCLETRHALFYKMWELGVPTFTNEIPTAAVKFDDTGTNIGFIFNKDYWNGLTDYERQFIICHECLHVILEHGARGLNAEFPDLANIAMDVVVNHVLVDSFGFEREKISMNEKLCWIDTVWKNTDIEVKNNECFEYYYNLLIENSSLVEANICSVGHPDDHSSLPASVPEDIANSITEKLSEREKEFVNDMIDKDDPQGTVAGTIGGSLEVYVSIQKVRKKKKWETVIKEWSKKYNKENYKEVEQWARLNRRFATLSSDMILPTDMEIEHETEGKIDVWFFQDTSGSCRHYAERFFKAAKTLDPKRFDVRLFCFDTKVYETSLKSGKLYGFGGTFFHILEKKVQEEILKGLKHPKAVFVITDGWGTPIRPQQPKKWYWFLTPYNNKRCIPNKCNIFQLKDYE